MPTYLFHLLDAAADNIEMIEDVILMRGQMVGLQQTGLGFVE